MSPEEAKDYGIIDAVYSVESDSLIAQATTPAWPAARDRRRPRKPKRAPERQRGAEEDQRLAEARTGT